MGDYINSIERNLTGVSKFDSEAGDRGITQFILTEIDKEFGPQE